MTPNLIRVGYTVFAVVIVVLVVVLRQLGRR